MANKQNPYAHGRVPSEKSASVEHADPALLHRGLGALVGSVYGGCLVAFFSVMLLAFAIKSGFLTRFDIGGIYPELGLIFLPICALPGGLLGGLVCGVTRGRRLLLALAVASVTPVMWLVFGSLVSSDAKEAVFIAFTLLLSATSSTLIIHLRIGSIVRRRREVVESMQADSSVSPGLAAAAFHTFVTICIVAALLTTLNLAGRPADYFAGMTAGAGIVGTWNGLHLLSAYPNRIRIGTLTTIVCVSAVLFPIFLKIYGET